MANQPDYQEQTRHNEQALISALKTVRPDIWVLMDIIDKTGINPFVLWKVGRAMDNIANGTKYGQVVVDIENNVVRFVRGTNADKINEPIIKTLNNNPSDTE